MNKALLIMLGLLMVLTSLALANEFETNNNFTITTANGGTFTFNYGGFKNVSNSTTGNWVLVTNGTLSVNYTLAAGETWSLLQNPTTCRLPSENMSITTNTQLCTGYYYLIDYTNDGAINGAAGAGGNNYLLDCNGAKFNGKNSSSGFVSLGAKNNVSITNCTFSYYTRGVYFFRTNNITISNNNFYNMTNASGKTIYIERTNNGNNNIFNNFIGNPHNYGYRRDGIYIAQSDNVNVFNNVLIMNTTTGYAMDILPVAQSVSTYIIIYNNSILIDGATRGIIIGETANNSIIANNTITGRINMSGIGLQNISISQIYGNIVNNTLETNVITGGGDCIQMSYSNNLNNISDNILENCPRSAIRPFGSTDGTMINYFYNNRIVNPRNLGFLLNVGQHILTNNSYSPGISTLAVSNEPMNLSINESSSVRHNFTSLNSGGVLYSYPGNKLFTAYGNSTSMTLTFPYNDIKNTSNGVILAENQASYSITLSPNQQIEVGQFQSENLTSSFTISGCYATLNNVTLNQTLVQFNYSHAHQAYTFAGNGTRQVESSLVSMISWVPLIVILFVAGLVVFLFIKNFGSN